MIALLGSALGFGTSFLPQVLGFFQKKQDHKNRIEELKLQGELASLGVINDIQKLDKRRRSQKQRRFMNMLTLVADLQQAYPHLSGLSSLMLFLAYSWPSKRSYY